MVEGPKQQKGAAARSEPLSDETVEMVAAMLKVLGDPTRIRLIEILNERGGATVSALAACVPVSQQGVSKQLGVLHQAGVVSRRRDGVWVRYELVDFTGWWLVQQLASALSTGSPTAAA
ncbi:MAG TPA: metalloregulator ArsR/SmtB family transcription factor [Solirubrobacterales bacterium]|nr:metalloregulator ArsR/SmtB family transcription factor [Solirubrobacterales bacterium]